MANRKGALISVIIFIIIALLPQVLSVSNLPVYAQDVSGKVKGIVVDWQDARVLGTTITFQNKRFRKSVTVNPDGEYEIELPAGSYLVTAQQPGFLQYRLKSLKVAPNEMRILKIKLS